MELFITGCRSSAVEVVNKDSSRSLVLPSPVLQFETMTVRIALGDAKAMASFVKAALRSPTVQYSTVQYSTVLKAVRSSRSCPSPLTRLDCRSGRIAVKVLPQPQEISTSGLLLEAVELNEKAVSIATKSTIARIWSQGSVGRLLLTGLPKRCDPSMVRISVNV
jgi:hypothetical protein